MAIAAQVATTVVALVAQVKVVATIAWSTIATKASLLENAYGWYIWVAGKLWNLLPIWGPP